MLCGLGECCSLRSDALCEVRPRGLSCWCRVVGGGLGIRRDAESGQHDWRLYFVGDFTVVMQQGFPLMAWVGARRLSRAFGLW